jgi:hypothetical protein
MSNQTDFEAGEAGASQNERVLNALIKAKGDWVAMPRLARVSGSYNVHSRVSALRKRGHLISQRTEVMTDGTRASHYRLVLHAEDCRPGTAVMAPRSVALPETPKSQEVAA